MSKIEYKQTARIYLSISGVALLFVFVVINFITAKLGLYICLVLYLISIFAYITATVMYTLARPAADGE